MHKTIYVDVFVRQGRQQSSSSSGKGKASKHLINLLTNGETESSFIALNGYETIPL